MSSVLLLGMSSAGWAVQPGPDTDEADGAAARQPDHAVTLITGDRVVLHNDNPRHASVEPGENRHHVRFTMRESAGQLSVVPSDMATAVASGRLDRRLFDITGLIRDGYDDSRTRSIPLIVTYDGVAGRASMRAGGAQVVRELPSINGTAVRVAKGRAFVDALPVSDQRFAGGVERVWLDGKRRTTLDQSMPQIGTAAAWQAGLTGKGVTVAVLDTGVDATHPDLADRVVEARNFTEGPANDRVGHGTHVASTVSGTAVASAGKYKGVAPDAKLLDGKVCGDEFCEESAILAGMQWAASEKHADVINLSIGGPDGPEVDPLEEAVNTLTAQTGALFVIAAGNSGPGVGSVDSPGSADAALTVGAVDKSDEIAEFSGRGPRVGDGSIKPDITAPGVDIVAARSKDGTIGDPVGDKYLRLSGTSMATPHVVGAAAILAQQHPDWTAPELKATLMSSAEPHAGQTAFDQGAGRVDLARAITQSVVSVPGTVSFGTALWPHNDDTPVTKQITYRNRGTSSVTLNLQASMTGPKGDPAPAGALTLSATSVTVRAGGTATVTVTSNTRHDGPDGSYSGRITATGPGGFSVTTPLGLDKEIESHNLTVTHLDSNGQPTGNGLSSVAWVDGVEVGEVLLSDSDGTASARLPKRDYLIQGFVEEEVGGRERSHRLVRPSLVLDKDITVVIDARLTRPIKITVERGQAKSIKASVGFERRWPGSRWRLVGSTVAETYDNMFTAALGEPVPDLMTAYVTSGWAVPGPTGDYLNSPFTYDLVNTQPGAFYTGFTRSVKDRGLARVKAHYYGQTNDGTARGRITAVPAGFSGWITNYFYDHVPFTVTHYIDAGPPGWSRGFDEVIPDGPGRPVDTDVAILSADLQYRRGKVHFEGWNLGVFGPAFPRGGHAVRLADHIGISVPMYSDRYGHAGNSSTDTAWSRLYRNGTLIGESEAPGSVDVVDVPGEAGTFTLATSATRSTVSRFSTRTDARWTFRSQTASEDGEPLPLWAIRYFPAVDEHNAVKRHKISVLPVKLEAQPGAEVGTPRGLQIQVSGDDGRTWTRASVRRIGAGSYLAVFTTPATSYVSLKANTADSAGNSTEQTIIRAYSLS